MDVPLLEDDLDSDGVLHPAAVLGGKRDGMPETAVLCFFQEVIDELIAAGAGVLMRLSSERGRTPVLVTEVDGQPLAVMNPGVGAPLAVMHMEELIELGARRIVAVGGAGALLPELTLGHAVVVESAVRDEGTSFHYLPPGRVVDADPEGVAALTALLDDEGVAYLTARTWTTDAIYRETRSRVARRIEEGCAVVEMEAASFIAAARYRGVRFAQLLLAGDTLAGETWDSRSWTKARDPRAALFTLASKAALTL
ncbi:nucleoside phosphorylase [Pseudonocardia sp. TRM90224]|uniref:nucleoside phosphorylase n=1 Tax=Pseudonocardia sp. TRM90224 TaxID=2812678 RepID=UPI001E2AEA2F|nr:nucleoside phosphorylase [Pseudonocardia sp. TRM90224]